MSTLKLEGRRVLNGAFGTLFWDNEPIFEVKEVRADIEINRGDVQTGLDVDSKILSMKGSGSFTIYHVYTRAIKKLTDAYKRGEDIRAMLTIAINDPDATGGQRERHNIGNVWFNKIALAAFTRGELIEKEFEFGFTPSDSDIVEGIY